MKKVVIIGVESTGKSTMTKYLAKQFNCPFVSEYARTYLESNKNEYNYEDFLRIAEGQARAEDQCTHSYSDSALLILDTDFVVISIWAEEVFHYIEPWIETRVKQTKSDLYLLLSPDIQWVQDGMREYPEQSIRERLHQKYLEFMENGKYNYHQIVGASYGERKKQALKAIENLLQENIES